MVKSESGEGVSRDSRFGKGVADAGGLRVVAPTDVDDALHSATCRITFITECRKGCAAECRKSVAINVGMSSFSLSFSPAHGFGTYAAIGSYIRA